MYHTKYTFALYIATKYISKYIHGYYIDRKEREGGRRDPNDTKGSKYEQTRQHYVNVQTISTKLAGNVPDLPLTFPFHLEGNPVS